MVPAAYRWQFLHTAMKLNEATLLPSLCRRVAMRSPISGRKIQQPHTQALRRSSSLRAPTLSTSISNARQISQDHNTSSEVGRARRSGHAPSVTSIIYISNPGQADVHEVAKQMPVSSNDSLTKLLFLVTPKLAHWFQPDSATLSLFVSSIYPEPTDKKYTVHVAIVDTLPGRGYFNGSDWFSRKPPQPHATEEGIAICLAHSVKRQPLPEGEEPGRALVQVLSRAGQYPAKEGAGTDAQLIRTVLSIPAANTLFVNGKLSTMFLTKWKRGSEKAVELDGGARALKHIGLVMPVSPKNLMNLRMPRFELTKARKVVSSMGNVVRELEGDNGDILKASTELEAAVPRLLAQLKEEGVEGQIQVFAKVTSGLVSNSSKSQAIPKHEWLTITLGDLRDNTRIFRVTSGGGGWGKKAGLLSLDPATSFDLPKSSESSMFPDPEMDELPSGLSVNLGALVPTGHTIEFFAALIPNAIPSSLIDTNYNRSLLINEPPSETPNPISQNINFQTQRWLFGNFSQAEVDNMTPSPQDAELASIQVLKDCFGVFSHNGSAVALQNVIRGENDHEHAHSESVNESKVDVPFALQQTTVSRSLNTGPRNQGHWKRAKEPGQSQTGDLKIRRIKTDFQRTKESPNVK